MRLLYTIATLAERDVRSHEIPLFRVRVLDEESRTGGFLNVVEERVRNLVECRDDFFDVIAEVTWSPNTQYVARAQNAYLSSNLRRKGVGAGLYLTAAEHCKTLGLVLVADVCAGGETSRDAERVYRSRTLADKAVVSGNVIAAR